MNISANTKNSINHNMTVLFTMRMNLKVNILINNLINMTSSNRATIVLERYLY